MKPGEFTLKQTASGLTARKRRQLHVGATTSFSKQKTTSCTTAARGLNWLSPGEPWRFGGHPWSAVPPWNATPLTLRPSLVNFRSELHQKLVPATLQQSAPNPCPFSFSLCLLLFPFCLLLFPAGKILAVSWPFKTLFLSLLAHLCDQRAQSCHSNCACDFPTVFTCMDEHDQRQHDYAYECSLAPAHTCSDQDHACG